MSRPTTPHHHHTQTTAATVADAPTGAWRHITIVYIIILASRRVELACVFTRCIAAIRDF